MNQIENIEDIIIGTTVVFIKEYTEHTLTKMGTIVKKRGPSSQFKQNQR